MAPASPRLRILSVGGNPVSAFLSWRLQASHACDVTLVWKSGHDTVSQYGISFKSNKFGNERFKPHSVVRSPEEAAGIPGGFDYVLLCVKALPDVYDVAAIIDSVVTPQHTCIVVNTTYSLGIESYLESRFPTNIVLSLVNGANINQLGSSEFEHTGTSQVWVGSTNQNPGIPMTLQLDMAEALALTLASGNVECHVSTNIRQQQWDKMIGPIAFQPLSVLLETPLHSALMEKSGAKKLIPDLIDELIDIAKAQSCSFPVDFKQKTIDEQLQAPQSMMYQDFVARRPLEIENYLGSPIKFAQAAGVKANHCQALYTVLHHINTVNQTKSPTSPAASINGPAPRSMRGPPPPGPQINGMNGQRRPQPPRVGVEPPMGGPHMGGRRGPPHQQSGPNMNGLHPTGYSRRPQNGSGRHSPQPPSGSVSRKNSFENDLEEFGHLALYDELADSEELPHQQEIDPARNRAPSAGEIALRERELQLRQRELALREHEIGMRHNGNGKPTRRKSRARSVYDDDDDDDDYAEAPPPMPPIDPDNFDMMSVTTRRTRRLPSAGNLRGSETDMVTMPPNRVRHSMGPNRPGPRSRASARLMNDVPGLHDPLTDSALMAYSSNRYGSVDRKMLSDSSRANSLTAAQRIDDVTGMPVRGGGGAYPPHPGQMPPPPNRRTSMSPSDARPNGYGSRPGYPADHRGYRNPSNGHPPNGQIPNGYHIPNSQQPLRQPSPRYPEGQGLPQQVGQISDGVSQTNLLKEPPNNRDRSTTGSASASADSGSGVSGEASAASSSSSLGRRMVSAVR